MTIDSLIKKYGTHSVSVTLRTLAQSLHDTRDAHGYDVTLPVIEEMAKDLEDAFMMYHVINKD